MSLWHNLELTANLGMQEWWQILYSLQPQSFQPSPSQKQAKTNVMGEEANPLLVCHREALRLKKVGSLRQSVVDVKLQTYFKPTAVNEDIVYWKQYLVLRQQFDVFANHVAVKSHSWQWPTFLLYTMLLSWFVLVTEQNFGISNSCKYLWVQFNFC